MKNIFKYSLLLLTAAITFPASLLAQNTDDAWGPDALVLHKEVLSGDKYMYKLKLEAYATGSSVTTHTTGIAASDIVLALDFSSSMVTTDYSTYTALNRPYSYNNTIISAPSKNVTKPYYYYDGHDYYQVTRKDKVKISLPATTYYGLYWNNGNTKQYFSGNSINNNQFPQLYKNTTDKIYTGGNIYTSSDGKTFTKSDKTSLTYSEVNDSGITYYYNNGGDPDSDESYYYVLYMLEGKDQKVKYIKDGKKQDQEYNDITNPNTVIYSGVLYTASDGEYTVEEKKEGQNIIIQGHSSTNPDEVFFEGDVYPWVSGQGRDVEVGEKIHASLTWNDLSATRYYVFKKHNDQQNRDEYEEIVPKISYTYTAQPSKDYTYNTFAEAANLGISYFYKDKADSKDAWPVYAEARSGEHQAPDFKQIFADTKDVAAGEVDGYALTFTKGGTTYYLTNDSSGKPTISTTPAGVTDPDATIYSGELYGQTRLTALQAAMADFVDVVYKNTMAGGDILLGVVNFSMNATIYKNGNISYIRVDTPEKVQAIKDLIYYTVPQTGTNHPDAMDKSHDVLKTMKAVKKGDGSNRDAVQNVILFTDGETYCGNDNKDNKKASGDETVQKVYNYFKKDGCDTPANVYCVSLLNQTTLDDFPWVSDLVQLVTSEWPDAKQFPKTTAQNPQYNKVNTVNAENNTTGQKIDGKQYYYQVYEGSTYDLSSVFGTIAEETSHTEGGTPISLDASTTTTIDVISDWFKLPDNVSMDEIKVWTAEYTGKKVNGVITDSWADPVVFTASKLVTDDPQNTKGVNGGKVVKISNFDYSANWVGFDEDGGVYTPKGKKLMIEIPIEVDPENPGGAFENTNESTSGIWKKNKDNSYDQIAGFEKPKVDNPNIIIIKRGLKNGESSLFTVTGDGQTIDVVTTCHNDIFDGDVTVSTGYIKIQRGDKEYKVTELSSWSWAYNNASSAVVTHTVSAGTEQEVYVDANGKLNILDHNTKMTDAQKASAKKVFKGTVYEFDNSSKTGIPDHGESIKQNIMVFSNNSSYVAPTNR